MEIIVALSESATAILAKRDVKCKEDAGHIWDGPAQCHNFSMKKPRYNPLAMSSPVVAANYAKKLSKWLNSLEAKKHKNV